MSDVLPRPLRFGVFLAPFHPADESPPEQLHRALALLQQLDATGFDRRALALGTNETSPLPSEADVVVIGGGLLMRPAWKAGFTRPPAVLVARVPVLEKGGLRIVLVTNGLFSGSVDSFCGRQYSRMRSCLLTKLRLMSSAFKFFWSPYSS